MKKVITEQVRQRTVKDEPIRDLCPRECGHSILRA